MMVLKDQLYSLSSSLMGSVCGIARTLKDALPERLNLVEYITLPDYSQRVILRFEVLEPIPRSAEVADALESRLRAAVGPDYWVNVRIDWSRTANKDNKTLLDHSALCERLQAIDKAYPDSVLTLPRTIHSRLVAEDADLTSLWDPNRNPGRTRNRL
jgi:hypothetical protein